MPHVPDAPLAIETGVLAPMPPMPSTGSYVMERTAPSPAAVLAHDLHNIFLTREHVEYHPGGTDVGDFIEALLTRDPRTISGDARAVVLHFAAELTDRYTPEGMQDGQ